MEEQRKKRKENSTELQKPNVDAEVYNNNKKCDRIHTHTHTHTLNKQNQNSSTKIKYNLANKGSLKLYLPEQN